MPNNWACCELHRTGTLFLLEFPGAYRESDVDVRDATTVYHVPPTWTEVPGHMQQFFADLQTMWPSSSPVQIAAFCLWRLNWIHPFKNGNGRSARAFTYACLCLKLGFLIPGSPTVIDLVMADRAPYETALRAADKALKDAGSIDFSTMEAYIEGLLVTQLSSIGAGASTEDA